MTITVQISRNGRSSPSPSGRRWREAPDEGLHSRDFTPLTRRFAPPSPRGRGKPPKQVGIRVAVPEPALALDIRRSRLRNLDSNGHRPPLQLRTSDPAIRWAKPLLVQAWYRRGGCAINRKARNHQSWRRRGGPLRSPLNRPPRPRLSKVAFGGNFLGARPPLPIRRAVSHFSTANML